MARRPEESKLAGVLLSMMLPILLPLLATASLSLSACGQDKPPAMPFICDDVLPGACPEPVPSYAVDVAPVLYNRCGGCHAPGKIEEPVSLDTYTRVNAYRLGILRQIDSCIMPPIDQPQATSAERATVLAWIVCGAPDN